MRFTLCAAAVATLLIPQISSAQSNPVAAAFRENEKESARNLIAAAEDFPAAKYGFKPTPAQMSFGDIVAHLSGGNDFLCSTISGAKAPTRSKISGKDSKEALVARLKETFHYCDESIEHLDDSKLSESLPFFGGSKMTRAAMIQATVADWADHYSQSAIYMRLNGMLPPTAKRKSE